MAMAMVYSDIRAAKSIPPRGIECRDYPRCNVHEDAVLFLLDRGLRIPAKILDLSLGGCRLRVQERVKTRTKVAVEVTFKIRGLPLRFSGVIQWTDGVDLFGIGFAEMSSRLRGRLAMVIADVEEANAALTSYGLHQA